MFDEETVQATEEKPGCLKTLLFDYVVPFLVALVIAYGIRVAVAQPFVIPSGSMLPTIQLNDRILANKFIYRLREPERGDVVVFEPKPEQGETPFVKRLIGLPGDTVEVKDGKLNVNGKRFKTGFAGQVGYTYGPAKVPPGMIFVLGDNRDNSYDSHEWGFLPRQNLIGKGFFVYWPLNHMKVLK